MPAADLLSPYLKRQLIAYIGNKRRLLPSLHRLFLRLEDKHPIHSMLDPFAGSGAVARLGRAMGYRVFANDWEEYSRIINRVYLRLSPQRAAALFSRFGGLEKLLDRLNSGEDRGQGEYFSRYYAPRSTEHADYRIERLFYTRENALFIDRVRSWIEVEYPADKYTHDETCESFKDERDLLIALLLYEAATHANTSGVFKAFHKGFGGYGSDALTRIMAPMQLEYPVLLDAPDGEVGCMDATAWVHGKSAELCYLDPPYTIHQYGSNYHILNSVALWDCPDVPLETGSDGRLKRKAGIREDWVRTRSAYCAKRTAAQALENLLEATDARFIVLSYNSDGLIPFEQLCDLLTERGRLSVFADDYVQYRGGKQGLTRKNLTTEFQLVVESRKKHSPGETEKIRRFIKLKELGQLLLGGFHPQRLKETGMLRADVLFIGKKRKIKIFLKGGYKPDTSSFDPKDFLDLSTREIEQISELLKNARFHDNLEEAEVLLSILSDIGEDSKDRRFLEDRFFLLLKKLAHKKYREIYKVIYEKATEILKTDAAQKKLSSLNELALRRFSG